MPALAEFRQMKDDYFARDPHSPLTPEQKQGFSGLKYFPENEDLRLHVEVEKYPDQEQLQMQTSTGDVQTYTRFGQFKFDVDGEESALTIYANEHGYFLPFVDALAGDETYGAGRYLEPEQQSNGEFLIDFNMAYNPYCAYNEAYSCPIPPAENRLKVAVRAGEMNFK